MHMGSLKVVVIGSEEGRALYKHAAPRALEIETATDSVADGRRELGF